jgi:hypothetical protein
MLLALGGLGMGQLAMAQQAPVAAPNPAPRAESPSTNITHETTPGNTSAISAPAAMTAAAPMTPYEPAVEKKKQNNKKADEDNKSPWWEPRDWNYIAEQGP